MPIKERAVDRGTRRARGACVAFGEELRRARREHGLTQRTVGRAVGLSGMHVSRVERGCVPRLSLHHVCRLAVVVGLEVSVKAYPGGSPIRDSSHRALLERLRAACPGTVKWLYEVPLPLQGDGRAWDAVLEIRDGRLAVEAETRLEDVQSLQRRLALKKRDDPSIDRLVLLVARTHNNRRVLREHKVALEQNLPAGQREVATAVSKGELPAGDALVVL